MTAVPAVSTCTVSKKTCDKGYGYGGEVGGLDLFEMRYVFRKRANF